MQVRGGGDGTHSINLRYPVMGGCLHVGIFLPSTEI